MAGTRERLRIIVTGYIARYPLGGVSWDYLQYPLGLARMGHDVYYFEDTGQWPYDPASDGLVDNYAANLQYLAKVMERFGLGDRWACRFPFDARWHGLPDKRRQDVMASADLVINVSGSLPDVEEYRFADRLVYVDSDPVFTQIKLARGQADFQKLVDAHDVLFSFGERLGDPVPATGHEWLPTRQPVVIDEWAGMEPPREAFTTVMNWTSYNTVEYEGRKYGQKDEQFMRFLDLPSRVHPAVMEVAANTGRTKRIPRGLLEHRGWRVVDPMVVSGDLDSYRRYIRSSLAEWSVAKGAYVEGQPGWFSCRSACYLAAGRPVVVQDTGLDGVLPGGIGIVPFRTIEEAVGGVRDVAARYNEHSAAAGEIARKYFDASVVLASLIDRAFKGAARTVSAGG